VIFYFLSTLHTVDVVFQRKGANCKGLCFYTLRRSISPYLVIFRPCRLPYASRRRRKKWLMAMYGQLVPYAGYPTDCRSASHEQSFPVNTVRRRQNLTTNDKFQWPRHTIFRELTGRQDSINITSTNRWIAVHLKALNCLSIFAYVNVWNPKITSLSCDDTDIVVALNNT